MRNTLILFFCLVKVLFSLAQKDSLIAYVRYVHQDCGTCLSINHEKEVMTLVDSANHIYKLHIKETYPSITCPDYFFNNKISFKIDTNKIEFFYDTAKTNTYNLFDFNVNKGDTEQIYIEIPGSGSFLKITIDSIVTRSFSYIGNRQVYYFSPSLQGFFPNYWIKGLVNNNSGFISIPHGIEDYRYTSCLKIKNNMIPIADTVNCGMYVMGADAPSHTKIKFSVSPNPATELLTITGELQATGNVRIDISNMLGQTITLANEKMPDKAFTKTVSIKNLPAGLYLLSLTQGETNYTQRIVKVGE
ncbi:MAG: T9SS type A sorting domain-containing protein [Bacteroidia bacterium]|nr:T9SS type A sorting domain-containing protein [Bacteroidia bacterium]